MSRDTSTIVCRTNPNREEQIGFGSLWPVWAKKLPFWDVLMNHLRTMEEDDLYELALIGRTTGYVERATCMG